MCVCVCVCVRVLKEYYSIIIWSLNIFLFFLTLCHHVGSSHVSTTVWLDHVDSDETLREKSSMGTTPEWTPPPKKHSICTVTCLPSHKPSKQDEQDMLGSARDVKMNS